MPAVIQNTPSGLIPKELFIDEKIQEYGNVLFGITQEGKIGKDDLKTCFLIYPKHNEENTIHEMSVMYHNIRDNYFKKNQVIGVNIYDEGFNVLVLRDMKIALTGYFHLTAFEDIVYHISNISQQFFEDIFEIEFFYQYIPPKILQFLSKYFEMKKL
jgi:hypothetical protein